jgi:hypothetical protein
MSKKIYAIESKKGSVGFKSVILATDKEIEKLTQEKYNAELLIDLDKLLKNISALEAKLKTKSKASGGK